MRFTLRQLQVFTCIAQQQSVSKAAEQLAMSQSAASTALKELELSYDCMLFDRAGKRLMINALGLELLPRALALLEQAQALEGLLTDNHGFGSLSVGATMTIGNYLATLLIGHFMQQHPHCNVRLHVHNTAQIVQQIANYQLDLGLIEGYYQDSNIIAESWIADELVVFCAPQHPLAQQGYASLDELVDEEWIVREQGSGTRLAFEQAFLPHQRAIKIRLELEHTEGIKRAVESGLGIGCISRLALRDAFKRGSLVAIETPELNLTRQFTFIWHKHKYQTDAMSEFLSLCRTLTENIQRSDQIDLAALV
ncbi:MAG: LysR family transcriptional regulator [Pseudomonas sp.]|jgi:DNA-binding transcriptional LysR family regulator|nr:LysR family transcriptional regulator [Pseudomonas sp.]